VHERGFSDVVAVVVVVVGTVAFAGGCDRPCRNSLDCDTGQHCSADATCVADVAVAGEGEGEGDGDGLVGSELSEAQAFSRCSGSSGTLFLSGDPDDIVHPGGELIPPEIGGGATGAAFAQIRIQEGIVEIQTVPLFASQHHWNTAFSVRGFHRPLTVEGVTDVVRADDGGDGASEEGHGGLAVYDNLNPCDSVTGSFVIHELGGLQLAASPPHVDTFSATFVQHCNGAPAALVGCIRIAP
jgi:hypothetical protein